MLIYPANHSVFDWRPELVAGYAGLVIPGTDPFSASTGDSWINLQEYQATDCHMQYGEFKLDRDAVLDLRSVDAGLFTHAQLKSGIVTALGGTKTVEVREGAFMLVKADAPQYECLVSAGKEYQSFLLYFRPELLLLLEALFPKLAKSHATRPVVFTNRSSFMNHQMRQIIFQVTHHPFDANTAGLYLEAKLREYLLVMLQHVFKLRLPRYRFAQRDIDKLVAAKNLLLQDLGAKPLTMGELAKASGLNEFKLKLGFRQLFCNSVFGCLHDARMEKARELLLETDKPLKEICVITGYPRITNFITAFKRHFGDTPASLRRREG